MTAPTSLTIRLGMCLAPALICASLLGGCVGASQKVATSKEQGDNSTAVDQPVAQTGVFNLTKQTVASGVTGLTFALLMGWLAWLATRIICRTLESLDAAMERVNEEPEHSTTGRLTAG